MHAYVYKRTQVVVSKPSLTVLRAAQVPTTSVGDGAKRAKQQKRKQTKTSWAIKEHQHNTSC
jgi:hypothetical protein